MLGIILLLGSFLLFLVMRQVLMHFNNIGFISNIQHRWLDMALFSLTAFPGAYLTGWPFAVGVTTIGVIAVYYHHQVLERMFRERNQSEEKKAKKDV